MTDQLKEIGQRLVALREIRLYSREQLAKMCAITEDELVEYEQGKRDFSFSFLYNASVALGVDVLDIMSGDSPKLSTCSMVRSGGGFEITRHKAYSYKHLAFTFKNKKAEPFMVTVEPADVVPTLHSHEGQEFNYIVEGVLEFHLGDMVYVLEVGDSVYFDSSIPHALKANGGKAAKLLAVVIR